jgi:hypothetical protein
MHVNACTDRTEKCLQGGRRLRHLMEYERAGHCRAQGEAHHGDCTEAREHKRLNKFTANAPGADHEDPCSRHLYVWHSLFCLT